MSIAGDVLGGVGDVLGGGERGEAGEEGVSGWCRRRVGEGVRGRDAGVGVAFLVLWGGCLGGSKFGRCWGVVSGCDGTASRWAAETKSCC